MYYQIMNCLEVKKLLKGVKKKCHFSINHSTSTRIDHCCLVLLNIVQDLGLLAAARRPSSPRPTDCGQRAAHLGNTLPPCHPSSPSSLSLFVGRISSSNRSILSQAAFLLINSTPPSRRRRRRQDRLRSPSPPPRLSRSPPPLPTALRSAIAR